MKEISKKEKWTYNSRKKVFVQKVESEHEFEVREVWGFWHSVDDNIKIRRARLAMNEKVLEALQKEYEESDDDGYKSVVMLAIDDLKNQIAQEKKAINGLKEFKKHMKPHKEVLLDYQEKLDKQAEELRKKMKKGE